MLTPITVDFSPPMTFVGLKTSEYNEYYNCVAWALDPGILDRLPDVGGFWWPDGFCYWPIEILNDYLLVNMKHLLATYGWSQDENRSWETGKEKIAVYATAGALQHVARMLLVGDQRGLWTSKLFRDIDVTHELEALCGPDRYGDIESVWSRPIITLPSA
jgi:hypothetical protein